MLESWRILPYGKLKALLRKAPERNVTGLYRTIRSFCRNFVPRMLRVGCVRRPQNDD